MIYKWKCSNVWCYAHSYLMYSHNFFFLLLLLILFWQCSIKTYIYLYGIIFIYVLRKCINTIFVIAIEKILLYKAVTLLIVVHIVQYLLIFSVLFFCFILFHHILIFIWNWHFIEIFLFRKQSNSPINMKNVFHDLIKGSPTLLLI